MIYLNLKQSVGVGRVLILQNGSSHWTYISFGGDAYRKFSCRSYTNRYAYVWSNGRNIKLNKLKHQIKNLFWFGWLSLQFVCTFYFTGKNPYCFRAGSRSFGWNCIECYNSWGNAHVIPCTNAKYVKQWQKSIQINHKLISSMFYLLGYINITVLLINQQS